MSISQLRLCTGNCKSCIENHSNCPTSNQFLRNEKNGYDCGNFDMKKYHQNVANIENF